MDTIRKENQRLPRLEVRNSDPTLYQQMVGSLIYASSNTRFDIAYATKEAARHLLGHGKPHFDMVKRIFRYLSGTKNQALFTPWDGPFIITVYCDADWASDRVSRRSTTGVLIKIDSMVIAFYSKEQKSVSLSTCEAELYALSQAVRLVGYFRCLLLELRLIPHDYCFVIQCDSQSAINLVNNDAAQIPAKHIDIRLKYLQEQVARGRIKIVYVNTKDNDSDICTKALAIDGHSKIVSKNTAVLPDGMSNSGPSM
jgi:hypothetical protein